MYCTIFRFNQKPYGNNSTKFNNIKALITMCLNHF